MTSTRHSSFKNLYFVVIDHSKRLYLSWISGSALASQDSALHHDLLYSRQAGNVLICSLDESPVMNANEWFERGSRAHGAGDYASAIEAFERASEIAPHSFDVWWALASACMLHGNQLQAQRDYRGAHPYMLRAADCFDRAVQANPSDSRAAKARDYAQTVRGAQEEKRRLGLL